jgi:hypothetical protein
MLMMGITIRMRRKKGGLVGLERVREVKGGVSGTDE